MHMKMLIILALIAGAGYWYQNVYSAPKILVAGNTLEYRRGGKVASYDIQRAFSESYMVFGALGSADDLKQAWFAGIPIEKARNLSARFPDFVKCHSKGAAEAKASVVSLDLLTEDQLVRKDFEAAAKEFDRRMHEKENRLCLRLKGRLLNFDGLQVGEQQVNFTDSRSSVQRLLVDRFEAVDCSREM